jgi:hypothetical protein
MTVGSICQSSSRKDTRDLDPTTPNAFNDWVHKWALLELCFDEFRRGFPLLSFIKMSSSLQVQL